MSQVQFPTDHESRASRALTTLEHSLYLLYRFEVLRALVIRWSKKIDAGSLELGLMRRIFRDYHDIVVGAYTYGGCFNARRVAAGTRIGRFCSFASNIHIFAANHKLDAVTTHPFIYNPSMGVVSEDKREYNHVRIGNDVWMGQHAMIVPSVSHIGDGAVIAAGALVTRDVPPYAVVAGVPARITRFRFSNDVIRDLLEIAWWDWPPERIFQNQEAFNSIGAFLRMSGGN